MKPAQSPLPTSDELERYAIGLLLQNPAGLTGHGLTEDHFVTYRKAFRALEEGFLAGRVVDGSTGMTALAGVGIPYSDAARFVEDADRADVMLPGVVEILSECADRRRWWSLAQDLLRAASKPRGVDDSVVDQVRRTLDAPRIGQRVRRESLDAYTRALAEECLVRVPGHLPGLSTGLADIDALLGGWARDNLHMVAARTSVGKSAFVLQCCAHQAALGAHVGLFSPEMRLRQCGLRLISQATGISSDALVTGHLGLRDKAVLRGAIGKFPPMWCVDDAMPSMAMIARLAREASTERPLDLLVVDQIGFVREVATAEPREKVTAIGRVTKALRALAQMLNCAVVVVAQINRQGETGEEMPRPTLSMLKDSGAQEEDADSVVLLHRKTRESLQAEIIVAKNRMGRPGSEFVTWSPTATRFEPRRRAA